MRHKYEDQTSASHLCWDLTVKDPKCDFSFYQPLTLMELDTSCDPNWLEASHWYWSESSSWAEDRLKESKEEESTTRSPTLFFFSSSVGGGAPSEWQINVTCSPSITSSPGFTDSEVLLGGSETPRNQDWGYVWTSSTVKSCIYCKC